jgi:hypothetical protein
VCRNGGNFERDAGFFPVAGPLATPTTRATSRQPPHASQPWCANPQRLWACSPRAGDQFAYEPNAMSSPMSARLGDQSRSLRVFSEDRRLFSDRPIPDAAVAGGVTSHRCPQLCRRRRQASATARGCRCARLSCSDHPVDGAGQVALGDVPGDTVQYRPVRREFCCEAELT